MHDGRHCNGADLRPLLVRLSHRAGEGSCKVFGRCWGWEMRLGVGGDARFERVVFALEMPSLLLDVVIDSCGIHYERRA